MSLGLTFDDHVSFVLTDSMGLKKLAFVDAIMTAHKENAAGNETAKDNALGDLAFIGGELRMLLPSLLMALGGEKVDGEGGNTTPTAKQILEAA